MRLLVYALGFGADPPPGLLDVLGSGCLSCLSHLTLCISVSLPSLVSISIYKVGRGSTLKQTIGVKGGQE